MTVGRRRGIGLRSPFGGLGRDLRLIFASNLAGSFGDGLYSYLLPVYMTEGLNANPVQVGTIYAVVNMFAALTLFLTGMLGDRYDRKKIMVAGWGVWVPAPLFFALARNWYEMLPGAVLWGSWLGGPTATAYVATATDRAKLTSAFAAMSAAWSLGYVISPALGGLIAAEVGMRAVFYLASLLYASAGFILLFIDSQVSSRGAGEHQEAQSFIQLQRKGRLLKLSMFFAVIMFTVMLFRPFISKFLVDYYGYGDFETGLSGSILFLGSAILGVLLGKLGDSYGRSYALASSLIFSSVSLFLLTCYHEFHIVMGAVFFAGCSYTLWSLMNAIIGMQAPESIKVRWVSIPQTAGMLCSFVAPYLGGVLYSSSPIYPFMVAIVLMLILALLASTDILEGD